MAPNEELIRVVVELEPTAEPIRGAVRTDDGSRPFDGWMQLTAALERARTSTTDEPADNSPSGRSGKR